MSEQDDKLIEKIVADRLPNMQVVKRKRFTKSIHSDAQLPKFERSSRPEAASTGAPPVIADADTDSDDADDVLIVNLEPKAPGGADNLTARNQVALVSRKKKKIIALRG